MAMEWGATALRGIKSPATSRGCQSLVMWGGGNLGLGLVLKLQPRDTPPPTGKKQGHMGPSSTPPEDTVPVPLPRAPATPLSFSVLGATLPPRGAPQRSVAQPAAQQGAQSRPSASGPERRICPSQLLGSCRLPLPPSLGISDWGGGVWSTARKTPAPGTGGHLQRHGG